jgi:hypothetical protein
MRRLLPLAVLLAACSSPADDDAADDAGAVSPLTCDDYWDCRESAIGVAFAATRATCAAELEIEVGQCGDPDTRAVVLDMEAPMASMAATLTMEHESGFSRRVQGTCGAIFLQPPSVSLAGRWDLHLECVEGSQSAMRDGYVVVVDSDLTEDYGESVDVCIPGAPAIHCD